MCTYEKVMERVEEIRLSVPGYPKAFFVKKEFKYLPELLKDNEEIIFYADGMLDGNTWLIVLTQRRIIFVDKGIYLGQNSMKYH